MSKWLIVFLSGLVPVETGELAMGELVLELTRAGYTDGLNRTLDKGVDVKVTGPFGENALHIAAALNKLELVKILAKGGVPVNGRDALGWTPAMLAAKNGNLKMLTFLHGKGASMKSADKNGSTVLMWACAGNHSEVIRYLLRKGVDINAKDKKGRTGLDFLRYNTDYFKTSNLMRELGAKPGKHKRNAGDLAKTLLKKRKAALAGIAKTAGYGYTANLPFSNKQAREYYLLGRVLLIEGKAEEAGDAMAEANRLEVGGCRPCQFPLVEIYMETGSYMNAGIILEELAAAAPKDPRVGDLFFRLGKNLADEEAPAPDQLGRAIVCLRKALNMDAEKYNEARFYIGRILDLQDELPDAHDMLSAYLEKATDAKHLAEAKERLSGLKSSVIPVRSLEGKRLDYDDYKGKVILYDFWTSDFEPRARKTIKILQKLHKQMEGKPFVILSVNVQQHLAFAKSYLADQDCPWPQFHDPLMNFFSSSLTVETIPSLVLVDEKGEEVYRVGGDSTTSKSIASKAKKVVNAVGK